MRRIVRSTLFRLGSLLLLLGTVTMTTAVPSLAQVEIPPIPDPVPVTLNADTTALIISDFMQQNCPNTPSCVAAMSPMGTFLERARAAGVLLLYTTGPGGLATSPWMPEVTPLPSEAVF